MTESEFTPNIPNYHDLLELYFVYGSIHAILDAFLMLKLSEEQPAFVEGGEIEILHKLKDALSSVDQLKVQKRLVYGSPHETSAS